MPPFSPRLQQRPLVRVSLYWSTPVSRWRMPPSFSQYADGAIVGSSLKVDGITWNPVDRDRVSALIAEVDSFTAR